MNLAMLVAAMIQGGAGAPDACIDASVIGKLVLVVENDQELRESMQHVLEDEGFPTLGADHGQSALDVLCGEGRLPDVVVLDLMMPVMNGWEFLDRVGRDARFASIPIVVIAATPYMDRDRVSCSLCKPMDLDDLLDAVRDA